MSVSLSVSLSLFLYGHLISDVGHFRPLFPAPLLSDYLLVVANGASVDIFSFRCAHSGRLLLRVSAHAIGPPPPSAL